MVLTQQRYTFEQWLEVPDDGRRYELLNGELVEMAPATANHALVVGALYAWLLRVRAAGYGLPVLGPVAVLLDAAMRRENAPVPDACLVRLEREQIITDVAIEGVPDLVVEILSRSTRRDHLPGGEKWNLYQRYGVAEYLIVDLKLRTVTQYTLRNGAYATPRVLGENDVLCSTLFPGITQEVASLFRDLRTSRAGR
jgi:Uma2 family endonuclease